MDDTRTSSDLVICVEQLHPRVCYAMETVFQEFLGLVCRLILHHDDAALAQATSEGAPIFCYTQIPDERFICLPCNGLLYEDIIRQSNEQVDWFGRISGQLSSPDHIARIFYHISQYGLLRPAGRVELDHHGRYPDGTGELVVHKLLKELERMVFPHLRRPPEPRKFDFEITIDVDQPWKYKHKPVYVRLGGILKTLLRGKYPSEQMQTLTGGKDPFDMLQTVRSICPPEKTKVFFLVGGSHANDSRYDLTMRPYKALVQSWKDAGFEIGIHPSYETYLDKDKIQGEIQMLKREIGAVQISRQHYLRYRNPDTFRHLGSLGIRREYSLCLIGKLGAPTGVALPYRWFDLLANQATDMVMVPAMAMDRTLEQYLGLTPEASGAAIAEWVEKVRAVSGYFVLILHNETFSESGEWKGWRDVIEKTVNLLRQ